MNGLSSAGKLIIDTTVSNSKQQWYFFAVGFMLAGFLFLNYSGRIYLPLFKGFLGEYLLCLIPFSTAYLLQLLFWKQSSFFREPRFWILLIIAPLLFSLRSYWLCPKFIISPISNEPFLYSSFTYCWRAIILILPILIFGYTDYKTKQRFHSSKEIIYWKLVFISILAMLPLLLLATAQKEFSTVYPKAIISAGLTSNSSIYKWVIFELSYALDFLSIELFFRGLLVIAFMRYVGMIAIIPMACFYCSIHFGKPMTEAISSFFGGILLGLISYQSKNIWTAFFIHLSMAWLMELTSFCVYHL